MRIKNEKGSPKPAGKDQPREAGKAPAKKMSTEELVVLHQTPEDDAGRCHKIRIYRAVVDGVKGVPKLEKRGFYKGRRNGDLLTGDREPFLLEDWKLLIEKRAQIEEVLGQGVFA